MMRITDSMRLATVLLDQSRASQSVYTLSQESASGNLINAPSDDPTGYATLVSMDSRLSIMQGRSAAATTASNNLDAASGALSSASDLLNQAKQLALEASSGSDDATSRANAGQQVTGLVSQLIALGNTQGSDGYLFGGTNNGTPPFSATGVYGGNNGVTQVEVADGVLTSSNVSGADAFTSAGGGNNVIADLQALATALSTNNVAGITSAIGTMDTDREQVTAVMVQAGAQSSSLQASTQLIANLTTSTETARSNLDSAATAQVYTELQTTETAYQASLSVTQQILSLQSFASSVG